MTGMPGDIILWGRNKPQLLCTYEGGNRWLVLNGSWTLMLDGLNGVVEETGHKCVFERRTMAPAGGDYNDILNRAAAAVDNDNN